MTSVRTSVAVTLAVTCILSACASLPPGSSEWTGRSEQVLARVVWFNGGPLHDRWLQASSKQEADGYVSYTKWGDAGYKYSAKGYFVERTECDPEANDYGLIQVRAGTTEFCTLNPEHGGFAEGNTFVITNSWDYCTRIPGGRP